MTRGNGAVQAQTSEDRVEGERLHALSYVPALDGLRAIAILSVVLGHLGFLKSGPIGVDIFFVLSGFLITSMILKSYLLPNFFAVFYYKRFLRLYPALLIMCLTACFVLGVILGEKSIYVDALSSLLYVQSIVWTMADGGSFFLGNTWSLSVEEQFYILWPLALILAVRANATYGPIILASMLLITIVLWKYLLISEHASINRMYFPLDTRGDALMIGAIGAIVQPALFRRIGYSYIGLSSLISAMLVAAIFLIAAVDNGRNSQPVGFMFCAASLGVVLGCVSPVRNPTNIVLSTRLLVWVGRLSYSLYLWHVPLFLLLQYKLKWGPLAIAAIGFPMALGLSCASYYGVERNIALRRGDLSPRLQRVIGYGALVFACGAIVVGTLFFQWSDIRELFDDRPLRALESSPATYRIGDRQALQPDGNLIFTFVPSRRLDLAAYAVVDGTRLVTSVTRTFVLIVVPKAVLNSPGHKPIKLFDSRDKLILDGLALDVVASR